MLSPQKPVARFAVVAGLSACSLVLSLVLRQVLGQYVIIPSAAAVLIGSWLYGREGGLLATVFGGIAAGFFFSNAEGAGLRILTYVVFAILISLLVDALRENKIRLTATLSCIGDAVAVTDRAGAVTFLNPVAEALVGVPLKDATSRPLAEVIRLVNEKTGEETAALLGKVLSQGEVIRSGNHTQLVLKDGHRLSVEESLSPIRDEHGNLFGAVLIFRDTTKQREAQSQLSHAQKMEAVGRLAGGVAGDFNNLLTVITGYSEMLRSDLAPGSPLRRFSDEILYAAERAAALTRQLLAFSRGQLAQPKLLDLNTLIANMQTMLQRLMGASIELVLLPGPGLGRVKSDPGQMEQMIVDLAMNSRDAMPQGGRLVIETSNIQLDEAGASKIAGMPPGNYVLLVVSDTGVGMTPETRERLFEPFFTTKTQGKGTGLGLSIVYGIVRQSQGYINVYSQLGAGTIFEIYLPRATETADPVHRPARPYRGSETILIADDEDGVRKLIHAVLATNGYSVIEARDGKEAFDAYERNRANVDMVLTDVVMPRMNGFELGKLLSELDPALKVLYMSGYRDGSIGDLDEERGRVILQKPFTPNALLAKVRELLDVKS